jgi:hypothetical protein
LELNLEFDKLNVDKLLLLGAEFSYGYVSLRIRKTFEEHLLNVSDLSMNVILRNVYVELSNSFGVEKHVSEHYLSSVFSPYQSFS